MIGKSYLPSYVSFIIIRTTNLLVKSISVLVLLKLGFPKNTIAYLQGTFAYLSI